MSFDMEFTAESVRNMIDDRQPLDVEEVRRQIVAARLEGRTDWLFYAHELSEGVRALLIAGGFKLIPAVTRGGWMVSWGEE